MEFLQKSVHNRVNTYKDELKDGSVDLMLVEPRNGGDVKSIKLEDIAKKMKPYSEESVVGCKLLFCCIVNYSAYVVFVAATGVRGSPGNVAAIVEDKLNTTKTLQLLSSFEVICKDVGRNLNSRSKDMTDFAFTPATVKVFITSVTETGPNKVSN